MGAGKGTAKAVPRGLRDQAGLYAGAHHEMAMARYTTPKHRLMYLTITTVDDVRRTTVVRKQMVVVRQYGLSTLPAVSAR